MSKQKSEKIPISIECIHQDYNITEPQPQLYVTNNFKDLIKILDDYSKTMGFKIGGKDGIKKAVLSEMLPPLYMTLGCKYQE